MGSGCIASYNSLGQYKWAYGMTSSTSRLALNGICLDSAKNIYIVGSMQGGGIDMDPSSSTNILTSIGTGDILVGKYDKNGQYLWSFNLGNPGSGNSGVGIAADPIGNIYISGLFSVADFDPSPTATAIVSTSGGFLAKYNFSGQYQYAFGGLGDGTFATSTDLFGNATVCGVFQDQYVDFDPNSPITYSPYVYFSDFFVAKYGNCIAPNTPINTSTNSAVCSGKSATLTVNNNGNIYWYASATSTTSIEYGTTYTTPVLSTGTTVSTYAYYPEVKTCTISPTRAVIIVTVNPLPTITVSTANTIICTGETTTLTANGASTYSWNQGGTGSTISVSPKTTNTYTVTGTDSNGCKNNAVITQSVSLCTDLNQFVVTNNKINIYPNPNNGLFKIEIENEIHNAEFILINCLGQKVHRQKITQGSNNVLTDKLVKGLYNCILIQNGQQICFGKLVLE